MTPAAAIENLHALRDALNELDRLHTEREPMCVLSVVANPFTAKGATLRIHLDMPSFMRAFGTEPVRRTERPGWVDYAIERWGVLFESGEREGESVESVHHFSKVQA